MRFKVDTLACLLDELFLNTNRVEKAEKLATVKAVQLDFIENLQFLDYLNSMLYANM